jgi:PAS domain S-box-containing protein
VPRPTWGRSSSPTSEEQLPAAATRTSNMTLWTLAGAGNPGLRSWAASLSICAICIAGAVLSEVFRATPFVPVFAACCASAWVGGFLPGLVTAVLSAVCVLVLVPGTWASALPGYVVGTGVAGVASWLIGRRVSRTRMTEEHLRSLVENMPVMLVALDEKGTIIAWNRECESVTGYTAEEIVGNPRAMDLLYPDAAYRSALLEAWKIRGDDYRNWEWTITAKDGSARTVLWTNLSARFPIRGWATWGIGVDVTERSRAEKNLKLLTDALPALIAYIDSDGRYRFNNRAYETWFGKPAEEMLGKHLSEVLGKEAYESLRPHVEAVLQGKQQEFEVRVPYATGGSRAISAMYIPHVGHRGRIEGFFSLVSDATERRKKEDELAASEERFRALASQAPAGIFLTDSRGDCIFVNRRWSEMTGMSAEKARGQGWAESLHPDDRERVFTEWYESAASKKSFESEYRFLAPDGRVTWVAGSAVGIRNTAGEIAGYMGTVMDITGRREAETEREMLLASERAARTEAERASRTKDEFLATLSHELRTPLQAILGWSRLLQSQSLEPEEERRAVETIERNARLQTKIIEDLLDMSRILSGKVALQLQRTDLLRVIESAVETVGPQVETKGIRLEKRHEGGPFIVRGDPERLTQVIWNLVSNAIKFTPFQGAVDVRLSRTESHAFIRVTDTGQGIRPEFLPYVFDRFRQADASTTRKHGGLGIGLAIVKHITELHGGSVKAESAGEGMGASFTVSLPLASYAEPLSGEGIEGDQGSRLGEVASLRGLKALVVDDEADSRNLVRRVLEGTDAEVVTAASSSEAMDELRRSRPDILISDIGMPGEDGFQLMRRIRALGSDAGGSIPAVALTAFARPEDRLRAALSGYQVHLAKPIDPTELIAVVASLTGRTTPS